MTLRTITPDLSKGTTVTPDGPLADTYADSKMKMPANALAFGLVVGATALAVADAIHESPEERRAREEREAAERKAREDREAALRKEAERLLSEVQSRVGGVSVSAGSQTTTALEQLDQMMKSGQLPPTDPAYATVRQLVADARRARLLPPEPGQQRADEAAKKGETEARNPDDLSAGEQLVQTFVQRAGNITRRVARTVTTGGPGTGTT